MTDFMRLGDAEMLKILFFNNFEEESVLMLFGIQIFKLVIRLGLAEGRFDNTNSIGLISIVLD